MPVNNNVPAHLDGSLSASDSAAIVNQNFQALQDSLNPFQLSDGSNTILNIGKDSKGKYNIKVAKPGFNAFDAADSNLLFNSNQDTFRIAGKYNATIPALASLPYNNNTATGSTSVVITHNLGYIPAFVAYYLNGAGTYTALPYSITFAVGGFGVGNFRSEYIFISATATTFTFLSGVTISSSASGTATNPALPVIIYALQETAN